VTPERVLLLTVEVRLRPCGDGMETAMVFIDGALIPYRDELRLLKIPSVAAAIKAATARRPFSGVTPEEMRAEAKWERERDRA